MMRKVLKLALWPKRLKERKATVFLWIFSDCKSTCFTELLLVAGSE